MADPLTPLVIASLISTAVGTASSIRQGEKQAQRSRRALREQKQAQAISRSAAASERQRQAVEMNEQRKKKPNVAALAARAQRAGMSGNTFLTEGMGSGAMTGRTRYLG